MGVRIFVDFDGTITKQDVGNLFFRTFGGPGCDEIIRAYRDGRISAVECFRSEAREAGAFDPEEAVRLFRRQEIDRTFGSLRRFAKERGFRLTVLSDGLDYYIREILEASGHGDVEFFSNRGIPVPAGGGRVEIHLEFPLTDAECDRCACCKRNIMLTSAGEKDVIVLVGEGHSDTCPARFADLVFAKAALQTYCQSENISYYPYETFQDVVDRLEATLREGKRLKKGHRAELRRQEAFQIE